MRLSKLLPSQRIKDRWLLYLEDGTILRVGEKEIVSFGLYAGMELSPEKLEALGEASKLAKLREKALHALSIRPLSRRELVRKLSAPPRKSENTDGSEEPISAELIEHVADWLEDLGYLNDEEYAKTIVRHYSAKGYGERKIQDELYRRGVPREYWQEALIEAQEPAENIDALIYKKMRGSNPGDRKALKRVSDALCRRGYRWDEIREGLQRYGAELFEDGAE